jgi:hypothetical protein
MLLFIFTGCLTYLQKTGESGVGHIQKITHFHVTKLTIVYSCVICFNSNNIHTKQFCGKQPWDYVQSVSQMNRYHLPIMHFMQRMHRKVLFSCWPTPPSHVCLHHSPMRYGALSMNLNTPFLPTKSVVTAYQFSDKCNQWHTRIFTSDIKHLP